MSHDDAGLKSRGGRVMPKGGQPGPTFGRLTAATFNGALWFLGGAGLRIVLRIGVVAILARLLAPGDFGVMAAASIVVALADLFTTTGVAFSVLQRRRIEPRHIGTAMTASLVTGALTGLAVFLAAPLAADLFRSTTVALVLQPLALLFPLSAASAVSAKLLERDLAYRSLALVEVATYVIGYVAVATPLAFAGAGVWALVGAQLGLALSRAALLLTLARRRLRIGFDWRSYRELMSVGGGFALGRIAGFLASKSDLFIVGRGLGMDQLGFYERASVLTDMSHNLLTSALNRVLVPAYSRAQDDRARLSAAYLRAAALVALIVGPVSVVLAALAPEIIAVLLGARWRPAAAVFQVLALTAAFRAGFRIAAMVANGAGAVYRQAAGQLAFAALTVAGAWLMLPYGLTAVALAILPAAAASFLVMTRIAQSLTGVRTRELAWRHLPALAYSAAAGIAAVAAAAVLRSYGAHPLQVLALASLAAAATVGGLAALFPWSLGVDGRWLWQMLGERLRGLRAVQGGAR